MKKIIVILSILTLLTSCSSCDNDNTNLLEGKWFMENYSCFCENSKNYTEKYFLWDINTENNTISVVNYVSDNLLSLTTGQYDFTYTSNTIIIQNGTTDLFYDYKFNDDKLILSNQPPEQDGPLITFTPKETNCINDPLEDYQWLADIKSTFEMSANPSGIQIIQYTYHNECVYLIDSCFECADNLIEVYNIQGEVICQFGGIAGINTCPNFYDIATNNRILFNNVQN